MASFQPESSVDGSTPIPSWLYNSSDPSLHVAEFLSDPYYQRFGGWNTDSLDGDSGHVLNWTTECNNPGLVFGSYGNFIGCLLYPNVTNHVANHSLPSNLSRIGFGWYEATPTINSWLWMQYTTCLVSMCTTQSDCIDTYDCSTRNLLTESYQLSGAGVSACWRSICSGRVLASTVDGDIAGVGILVSYLLQTVIALLGLGSLSTLAFLVWYHKKKGLSTSAEGSISEGSFWKRTLREHWAIGSSVLSEFHKAQCYFAIALQIAALILLSSEEKEVTFTSLNFLLLVGLDGVLPVVMTLYTLMTFSEKAWYTVSLSLICIIISSYTGLYVATRILGLDSSSLKVGATGNYSPACGGNGPEGICIGFPNVEGNDGGAAAATAAIIIMMDIIAAALLVWMITEHVPTDLAARAKYRLLGRRGRKDASNSTAMTVRSGIIILLHATAGLAIAACVCLEFYWFHNVFTGPWVDFKDWGFGQIVGLTAWFGVFIELAYLEYFGLEEGMNWRFPAWLKVKNAPDSKESEHDNSSATLATPSDVEYQKMSVSGVQVISHNQLPTSQALFLQLHDQNQNEPKRRATEPANLK